MTRKPDEQSSEHLICLKDKEWREVHDFIAGTASYRRSLDADLRGIKSGMWGVALVVLIPFLTGMIWIGAIGAKVEQNCKDIVEIRADVKEIRNHGKL